LVIAELTDVDYPFTPEHRSAQHTERAVDAVQRKTGTRHDRLVRPALNGHRPRVPMMVSSTSCGTDRGYYADGSERDN
jgi:hypothetical protein